MDFYGVAIDDRSHSDKLCGVGRVGRSFAFGGRRHCCHARFIVATRGKSIQGFAFGSIMVAGEWSPVEVVPSQFPIVMAAISIEASAMGEGQGWQHKEKSERNFCCKTQFHEFVPLIESIAWNLCHPLYRCCCHHGQGNSASHLCLNPLTVGS